MTDLHTHASPPIAPETPKNGPLGTDAANSGTDPAGTAETVPDGPVSGPTDLRTFRVDFFEAQQLYGLSIPPSDGSQATMDPVYRDNISKWWLGAGSRLGFIWSTVTDLHWETETGQPPKFTVDVVGVTFKARPHPLVEAGPVFDEAAKVWVANWHSLHPLRLSADASRTQEQNDTAWMADQARWAVTMANAAFVAGRDIGYAMGTAEAKAHKDRARKLELQLNDAAELLAQGAALFREYEAHHRDQMDEERSAHGHPRGDRAEKTKRNATIAANFEDFLNDPSNGTIAHDGLREAREDAQNGVAAGWTAAISAAGAMLEQMAVDLLAPDPTGHDEGNRAYELRCAKSGLDMLPQPDDLDELLNPWRGVMAEVARVAALRGEAPEWMGKWSPADHVHWAADAVFAFNEYHRRTDWVQEAVQANLLRVMVPKAWGMHRIDVIMELLNWSNTATGAALKAVDGLQEALGQALHLLTETEKGSFPGFTAGEKRMVDELQALTKPMAGVEQAQVDALHKAYHEGKGA